MQTIGANDVKSKSSAPKSWEMNVKTDLSPAHLTLCKVQAPNSCKDKATAIRIIREGPSNTHPFLNNHNTSQIWFHHQAFTSLNSSKANWHRMAATDSTLASRRSTFRTNHKEVFPAQIHTTIINSRLKCWGMVSVNRAMWAAATPKLQICPNPKSNFKIANTHSNSSSRSTAQLPPKLKIIITSPNNDNSKVFLTIISMAVLNSNKLEWVLAHPWQTWWCKDHPSTPSSTITATQYSTSTVASTKEPTSPSPISNKIINSNIDTKVLVSNQLTIPTTFHATNCKRRATHPTRLLMPKVPCSCWRWDSHHGSSTLL